MLKDNPTKVSAAKVSAIANQTGYN